jgi:hypothetical protein
VSRLEGGRAGTVRGVRAEHPRARSGVLLLALCALVPAACGSSSSSSSGASRSSASASSTSGSVSSTATASSRAGASSGARVHGLELALRKARAKPPISAARCRPESAAQRSQSPFGKTGPPVFSCSITASGAPVAYDVQLLPSGCFVAERTTSGKAIYGCGAGKA